LHSYKHAKKDQRSTKRDYRKGGCTVNKTGGKGSHRKITNIKGDIEILAGKDNADAKPYQEKALKKFLK
jgi:hypothetical protein